MAGKGKMGKRLNKATDTQFNYVVQVNPELEFWRSFAAEWFAGQKRSRGLRKIALDKFLLRYLHRLKLEMNPYSFLRRDYPAPSFFEHLGLDSKKSVDYNNFVHEFLAWVLHEKLSMEDDYGHKVIPAEYWNPVPRRSFSSVHNAETYKAPLPYRYIRDLRRMLCQGPDFRDWVWAQQAVEALNGGDWFEVDPAVIDRTDPDCVWRKRIVTVYRKTISAQKPVDEREIYEIWSPVRATALYVKLELPLRTLQVRMLDSGESDTWRYDKDSWRLNAGPLAMGSEKRPSMRGVFHRSIDATTGKVMTGFYINTNKTADINKEEKDKGYTIPWQNETVLYWLEKLRNWQEKYNPLSEPTHWTALEVKHLGKGYPHEDALKARGTACFLFRHAAARSAEDRTKPLVDNALNDIWYRLLVELERRCEALGETLDDGSKIEFVHPDSRAGTHYPLHSLRVSLITAYALEGGVPFPILSKLIAGHARLIMTLYYTKAGKAHVTEIMREAEKKMFEEEKSGYRRFLQEATYQQIEECFAVNDPAALHAASQQRTSASFVFEDKGICIMGCGACDIGGEEMGKKSNSTLYGSVPGFPPQKNCVRCRFFITGPAFLPGLIVHFNHVSYQLTECSRRFEAFERQVSELEGIRLKCEESGLPFTKVEDLDRLSRFHEEEAQKADKLCNDLHATLSLIDRCTQLLQTSESKGVNLVPVGTASDVGYALEEIQSDMLQYEVICQNALLYPEVDASRATLRRSQILDAMLQLNDRVPVFLRLTDEQQLMVGNHLMQMIAERVGTLKNAVAVAEGKVLLKDIGLLDEIDDTLERQTGIPLPHRFLLPYPRCDEESIPTRRELRRKM